MGILDAPPIDALHAKATGAFHPPRDLRNVIGWWDGQALSGLADGTAISVWKDQSGLGWNLANTIAANRPTKQTYSGKPVARFATSNLLKCAVFGASGGWPDTAAYAQPLTIITVAKLSSSNTGNPILVSGEGTTQTARFGLNASTHVAFPRAGSAAPTFSPDVFDDAWHIITCSMWATGNVTCVDGWVVGGGVTQAQGAEGMAALVVGNLTTLVNHCIGDVGEIIICNARLSFKEIEAANTKLGAKWGITTGLCATGIQHEQTTSPNGQAVRIWTPPVPSTPATLVLYQHQSSASEQIVPSFWSYGLIHAAIQKGWYVAASNMRGNSWGNNASLADMLDLYTQLNTRHPIAKVILVGASMGGIPTALAVDRATVPNIVGAYLIDPALNLTWVYGDGTALHRTDMDTAYSISAGTLAAGASIGATSVSSTVSFPNGTVLNLNNTVALQEQVTVNGAPSGAGPYTIPVTTLTKAHLTGVVISDMPTKIAGNDPALKPGGDFPSIRWRFVAGSGDTLISKTLNTDLFQPIIASGALESTIVPHFGDHLAGTSMQPADFVAFALRCIA